MALDLTIALWRDDDLGSYVGDLLVQAIGIVALVGDRGLGLEAVDERVGKGNVVALPWRANQANGKPERIAGSMDLRAQAAARPTQALGIRPPFSLRAPAAC